MAAENRIKKLREEEGINQTELAKRISTTRAAVNAWEAGINQPRLESLLNLSDYFNVTIDYIAGRDEPEAIIIEHLTSEQKRLLRHLVRMLEYKAKLTK